MGGETAIVARTLNVDFIYLDILFICIYAGFMIKKKYWTPIIWGLIGWVVYIFVDYYLWHIVMKSRHYVGPVNETVFFMWFTFSPGFVQFSYAFVMFEKRNFKELIFWTALFYLGWTFVSVGSQLIPIDDRIIRVWRDMNADRQRLTFTIMAICNVVIGCILALKKKLRWEDVLFLFIVGTLDEFALEFTLTVSGIRLEQGTWSPLLMLVNTLIEFNMGVVLMWLLFAAIRYKRDDGILKQLGKKDFKNIRTNFNVIAQIIETEKINEKRVKECAKLYNKEDILHDLAYYNSTYHSDKNIKPILDQIEQYL